MWPSRSVIHTVTFWCMHSGCCRLLYHSYICELLYAWEMGPRCVHIFVSVCAYTSLCASTEVLVMGSLYISFKFHTQGDDPTATPVPLPEFMPNAGGLMHHLPDGVLVQLRLHLVDGRYQVGVLSIMHTPASFEYVCVGVTVCDSCIRSAE